MRYRWFSVNNDLSKMAAENLSSDPSLGNVSSVLSPPQRLRGKTAGRKECGRKRREGFHQAVFSLTIAAVLHDTLVSTQASAEERVFGVLLCFSWKGFVSSRSTEKEARKAYIVGRGITIFDTSSNGNTV